MSKTNNKRSAEELDGQVDYKELFEEALQNIEELQQACKKNSVMHYANLEDGDIQLEFNGGTPLSSVNPKNHEEVECSIKSDVWSTKCTATTIMSTYFGRRSCSCYAL